MNPGRHRARWSFTAATPTGRTRSSTPGRFPGSPPSSWRIISGHHGVPRMGEMVLFDAAKGRQEDAGAVQRIPGLRQTGRGDHQGQAGGRFLAEVPASLSAERQVFPGLHASPRRSRPGAFTWWTCSTTCCCSRSSPATPCSSRIPFRQNAAAAGDPGQGQPRQTRTPWCTSTTSMRAAAWRACRAGTVKKLRVYQVRILLSATRAATTSSAWKAAGTCAASIGTVPVEADGSAMFQVPANTPVAVQPLDAEGKALQLMRSWFVGMPGENLSCVGLPRDAELHRRACARPGRPQAAGASPTPWYGPKRGFSFMREVQPVLDKYCVGCHDGQARRARTWRMPRSSPPAAASPPAPVLHGAASLRAPQRARRRLPHADAAGIPRRHQPTGADAPQRAITT